MSIKLHGLSRSMARDGFLFFTFGLILLGLEPSEILFLPKAPPSSNYLCAPCGVALILTSLMAIFAIIWMWWKYKLTNFLKDFFKKKSLKPVTWLTLLHVIGVIGAILSLIFVGALFFFILWLLNTIPSCFFEVLWIILGVVAILASLPFMVAVFRERSAVKLKGYLEGQFQRLYWSVFLLVSLNGWLTGLASLITEGTDYYKAISWIVLIVGFAWFFVIWIIAFRILPKSREKADQKDDYDRI